jgi:thymidine kinase
MKREVTGKLEVICGTMFSGKSEELMYRLRRAEYAKKKVLTIKPEIDTRNSLTCIVSHDGSRREAYPIGGCNDSMNAIMHLADETVDVIGIDEIQFFPEQTIDVISELVSRRKRVIVAGLDMDFRGEPFGIVPHLMAIAEEVHKLQAICMVCGDEANFPQRLINGRPAKYDDPVIMVGGSECYEPRCRRCFVIEKQVCCV